VVCSPWQGYKWDTNGIQLTFCVFCATFSQMYACFGPNRQRVPMFGHEYYIPEALYDVLIKYFNSGNKISFEYDSGYYVPVYNEHELAIVCRVVTEYHNKEKRINDNCTRITSQDDKTGGSWMLDGSFAAFYRPPNVVDIGSAQSSPPVSPLHSVCSSDSQSTYQSALDIPYEKANDNASENASENTSGLTSETTSENTSEKTSPEERLSPILWSVLQPFLDDFS
jgi:hypothetical protein